MIGDAENLEVEEKVVLKKFEGEPIPENEFERVVIQDGTVVEHLRVESGEPVGPVYESELLGKNVGKLFQDTQEKEVD